MNPLDYQIAITRQEELLRQAAAHRLARPFAATARPALIPRRIHPRAPQWTIRALAAALRDADRSPAIRGIRRPA